MSNWITENADIMEMLPSDMDTGGMPLMAQGTMPQGMNAKQLRQATAAQKKAMRQQQQASKQYMKLYNQQMQAQSKLFSRFPQFMQQRPMPVARPGVYNNNNNNNMFNQPYNVPAGYYQSIQPMQQPPNYDMVGAAPAAMYHDAYAATGQPSAPLWAEVPAADYSLYDPATPVDDMVFSQGLLGLGAEAADNTPAWAKTFEAVTNKLVDTGAGVYQRIADIRDARRGVVKQPPMLPPAPTGFLGMSQGTWAAVGVGALALGAAWAVTRKKRS